MIIGVLSDTHLPRRGKDLPSQLLKSLARVDAIIHAGDFTSLQVLTRLQELAPVYAVFGNMDCEELRKVLPPKLQMQRHGFTVGIVHGDGSGGSTQSRAWEAFPNADCIIHGHSHIPGISKKGRRILFNPGSPLDKRSQPYHTYGRLTIEPERLKAEILALPAHQPYSQETIRL